MRRPLIILRQFACAAAPAPNGLLHALSTMALRLPVRPPPIHHSSPALVSASRARACPPQASLPVRSGFRVCLGGAFTSLQKPYEPFVAAAFSKKGWDTLLLRRGIHAE